MLQQPPWTENGAWEIQAKQTLCKSPHLWVIHTEEFIGENDICWDLLWNNPAGAGGGGRELQKTQGEPCGEHLLKLGDGHLMAHYSIPCLHVWEFSYFHNEKSPKKFVRYMEGSMWSGKWWELLLERKQQKWHWGWEQGPLLQVSWAPHPRDRTLLEEHLTAVFFNPAHSTNLKQVR